MNNPRLPPSNRPMLTRRSFFGVAAAGAASFVMTSRVARAQGPKAAPQAIRVEAGDAGVAAIAAVVLGSLGDVSIASGVAPGQVRIDGAGAVSVIDRVLLKGEGEARDRFMDDARNAPRVAINLKDRLSAAHPAQADAFTRNERAWAKPFTRKAFDWSRRLTASPLAGKAVRDTYGRVYVLEWAGATVDPAGIASPAALGSVKSGGSTIAAYEAYLEALVSAVAG